MSIFAQIFQTDGTKVGSEFQINSTTANNQANSKVLALLSSGNFLAVWDSEEDKMEAAKVFMGNSLQQMEPNKILNLL